MSADNTVIVLKTKGRNGSDAEYRVVHVQCAENMIYEADYPSKDNPRLSREWTLNAFRRARAFTNAEEALTEAARVEEEVGYVEYGICVYDFSDIFFPASDRKRRQRRFVRHAGQGQSSSTRL